MLLFFDPSSSVSRLYLSVLEAVTPARVSVPPTAVFSNKSWFSAWYPTPPAPAAVFTSSDSFYTPTYISPCEVTGYIIPDRVVFASLLGLLGIALLSVWTVNGYLKTNGDGIETEKKNSTSFSIGFTGIRRSLAASQGSSLSVLQAAVYIARKIATGIHAGVKITSPYARRGIIWSFGTARRILAYGCKVILQTLSFGGCLFVSRCLPWLARSILKTALWVKERLPRNTPTGNARQSTKRTFPPVPVPPPPLTVAPPRWTRWVEITVDGVVRAQIHPKNILAKELLGRGAFGSVSNGVDLATGKALAIKRVSKASMGQEGEYLVLAEARAMSRASKAQGPYPVLHGFFIDEVDYIFVMDHLAGGTLYHRIGTQGVSRPEALLYAAQLFVAIKGIHDLGIIHRDIKPDNIFLDCHGKLVLGDFGLAKLFDMNVQGGPAWNAAKEAGGDHFPMILPHGNPHTDTAWRGTDVYGAPEARSGETYSYGVDYYSFAVCFFEMVTGLWPYRINDFTGKYPDPLILDLEHAGSRFLQVTLTHEDRDFFYRALDNDPYNRMSVSEMKNHPIWPCYIDWPVLEGGAFGVAETGMGTPVPRKYTTAGRRVRIGRILK